MLGYLKVQLFGVINKDISLFNIFQTIIFLILIQNSIILEFVLHRIFAFKISVKQIKIKILLVKQYFVLMIHVTEEILMKKFTKLLIILEYLQQLNSYISKMDGTQMKQYIGLTSFLINLLNKLKINLLQQLSLI